MSVQLYPDHKAILHFQDSLKVFQIDFLAYLTAFLARTPYADRHFDLYVQPTLLQSAFDFIIVEPNQAVYILQTPETVKKYHLGKEQVTFLMSQRLAALSPSLKERIDRTSRQRQAEEKSLFIRSLFYLYDEKLTEKISPKEQKSSLFITAKDFKENSESMQDFFEQKTHPATRLTQKESEEIQYILNPNTNMKHYTAKNLPENYEDYAVSRSQAKQKFKGAKGSGKTLLLVRRAINCANRLHEAGRLLIVSGDRKKVSELKDLVTAEDGRSLQELGIDISSFQELVKPIEKYRALFIDDAHCLSPAQLEHLLLEYLVEMTEKKDYEYVVMADDESLPTVPQIFGPFRTLIPEPNFAHQKRS